MKITLVKRIAELGMAIDQATQNVNTLRGQKLEAEAFFNHIQREEAAEKAKAEEVPVEQPPQSEH